MAAQSEDYIKDAVFTVDENKGIRSNFGRDLAVIY